MRRIVLGVLAVAGTVLSLSVSACNSASSVAPKGDDFCGSGFILSGGKCEPQDGG